MSAMEAKLKESIKELEHALTFRKKAKTDRFFFNGISKAYECAWNTRGSS